jgi:hypothetical protein
MARQKRALHRQHILSADRQRYKMVNDHSFDKLHVAEIDKYANVRAVESDGD